MSILPIAQQATQIPAAEAKAEMPQAQYRTEDFQIMLADLTSTEFKEAINYFKGLNKEQWTPQMYKQFTDKLTEIRTKIDNGESINLGWATGSTITFFEIDTANLQRLVNSGAIGPNAKSIENAAMDQFKILDDASKTAEQKVEAMKNLYQLHLETKSSLMWGSYINTLEGIFQDPKTPTEVRAEAFTTANHFDNNLYDSIDFQVDSRYQEQLAQGTLPGTGLGGTGYEPLGSRSAIEKRLYVGSIKNLLKSSEQEGGGYNLTKIEQEEIVKTLAKLNITEADNLMAQLGNNTQFEGVALSIARGLVKKDNQYAASILVDFHRKRESDQHTLRQHKFTGNLPNEMTRSIPNDKPISQSQATVIADALLRDPYALAHGVTKEQIHKSEIPNGPYIDIQKYEADLENMRGVLTLNINLHPESRDVLKQQIRLISENHPNPEMKKEYQSYLNTIELAEKSGISNVFSFQRDVLEALVNGQEVKPSEGQHYTTLSLGTHDPVAVHTTLDSVIRGLVRDGHIIDYREVDSSDEFEKHLQEQTLGRGIQADNIIVCGHGVEDMIFFGDPKMPVDQNGLPMGTPKPSGATLDSEDIARMKQSGLGRALKPGGTFLSFGCDTGVKGQSTITPDTNIADDLVTVWPDAGRGLSPKGPISTGRLTTADTGEITNVEYLAPTVSYSNPEQAFEQKIQELGSLMRNLGGFGMKPANIVDTYDAISEMHEKRLLESESLIPLEDQQVITPKVFTRYINENFYNNAPEELKTKTMPVDAKSDLLLRDGVVRSIDRTINQKSHFWIEAVPAEFETFKRGKYSRFPDSARYHADKAGQIEYRINFNINRETNSNVISSANKTTESFVVNGNTKSYQADFQKLIQLAESLEAPAENGLRVADTLTLEQIKAKFSEAIGEEPAER